MKLNLGIGIKDPMEGYINLDILPAKLDDVNKSQWIKQGDFRNPVNAGIVKNSVNEIRASHILRNIHVTQLGAVINNWKEVLTQGGELYIETLDAELVGNLLAYQQFPLESINLMIYGDNPKAPLCGMYSLTTIEPLLNTIGFETLEKGYIDRLNMFIRVRKL